MKYRGLSKHTVAENGECTSGFLFLTRLNRIRLIIELTGIVLMRIQKELIVFWSINLSRSATNSSWLTFFRVTKNLFYFSAVIFRSLEGKVHVVWSRYWFRRPSYGPISQIVEFWVCRHNLTQNDPIFPKIWEMMYFESGNNILSSFWSSDMFNFSTFYCSWL